ncbi:MAG TPA: glycosyltransferase [Vicinamibacterales bacterium]
MSVRVQTAPAVLLAASYGVKVGYAWNNIYRLFNAVMRALHERGLRIVVSFREIDGPTTIFDPDLPFETLVFDPRRVSLSSVTKLAHEIRHRNIRHVYLTDQPAVRWDYPLMRAAGVRTIVTHNRISVPDPRPAVPVRGPRGAAKRLMHRLPWAGVDRVFAVSNFVRDRLVANGVPASRVRTILNGIDVDGWRCPEPVADSPQVTFFAGARAMRYKGGLTLIEAAARLRSRHGIENFRVRYAGDGPDLELFRDTIQRLGLVPHVELLGKLDSTRAEVCRADVIVVPSEYGDACPSTVSEALASGRPLIATVAGGIPELVGDPGNAVLVPPGDADRLAEAMASLVHDPERRRQIGLRGRQRAEQALRQESYHAAVIDALLAEFGEPPRAITA